MLISRVSKHEGGKLRRAHDLTPGTAFEITTEAGPNYYMRTENGYVSLATGNEFMRDHQNPTVRPVDALVVVETDDDE